MGIFEMPLLGPVTRSVSSSISLRTSSKSVKIRPLQCRNSAYSIATNKQERTLSYNGPASAGADKTKQTDLNVDHMTPHFVQCTSLPMASPGSK